LNALISETPHANVVTASRTLVDKLLAMNTKNRRPKEKHVENLSSDVASGDFLLTASGVGVSRTGVLLDGQHRLMAIRKAGYPPVQFVLVTGLEDDSQLVVDRHAKRSLSDALSMHMNITVSSHMVAMAQALYAFNGASGKHDVFRHSRSGAAPDSLIGDFMAEHNELCCDIVRAGAEVRAPVLAAIFVYALHDRENAIRFAREVSKGIELKEDSPAYRLRTAMDRLKRAQDSAGRLEIFSCAASACISDDLKRPIKLLRPVESWATARWKWAIPAGGIFVASRAT
jgi:hypothetical protein